MKILEDNLSVTHIQASPTQEGQPPAPQAGLAALSGGLSPTLPFDSERPITRPSARSEATATLLHTPSPRSQDPLAFTRNASICSRKCPSHSGLIVAAL